MPCIITAKNIFHNRDDCVPLWLSISKFHPSGMIPQYSVGTVVLPTQQQSHPWFTQPRLNLTLCAGCEQRVLQGASKHLERAIQTGSRFDHLGIQAHHAKRGRHRPQHPAPDVGQHHVAPAGRRGLLSHLLHRHPPTHFRCRHRLLTLCRYAGVCRNYVVFFFGNQLKLIGAPYTETNRA